jgi:hypothetical protein
MGHATFGCAIGGIRRLRYDRAGKGRRAMAKGQMRSNKEKRKPKADKGKKQIAANPSNKSGQTGLKVFDE